MLLPILALGVVSLIISFVVTAAMIRIAPKLGFVDNPGGRKVHANPKPLGGGVGIFWGWAVPWIAVLIYAYLSIPYAESHRTEMRAALVGGVLEKMSLAIAIFLAALALHVLGLIDDRKALGPSLKLLVQLAAATAVVIPFHEMRVLSALGSAPSIIVSVLWIVAITNAFNFLDNMDGLSAGTAAVATTAFLVTTLLIGQLFVAAGLVLLLGALLGFLVWNFPPAKIFMGDGGSLVIGFLLGVLTVRTTYLPPEKQADFGAGWYAVFAPVIVLALPLYDLIVVSIIRLSRGKSPFVGDTNHFSHRLVARGMSRRTAVLCLYLVTAATSVAAIILPYARTTFAAMLIFAQTLMILCLVALLEQHPLPGDDKVNG
jgi:UDP-GlcNAc:undecaprenyl-phosphate GlcNAc-1-phosphate transferase